MNLSNNNVDLLSFNKLFAEYHQRFVRFAYTYVDDYMEAEDIVMEAMTYYWENRTRLGLGVNPSAYIFTAIKNKCLNYLRDLEIRDRNYKNLNKEELDEDYFLCQQIRADVVAELFDAIDELPDRCKEIFKRSYVDGQEERKIAEELNISLNTIKTQKQRAKSYLRGRLGDLFVYAGMFFPGL